MSWKYNFRENNKWKLLSKEEKQIKYDELLKDAEVIYRLGCICNGDKTLCPNGINSSPCR